MRTRSVLLALLAAVPIPAVAGEAGECLRDARQELRECRRDCAQDFLADADICRNLDPACTAVCRDARRACLVPARQQFRAAVRTCDETLATAARECRQAHPGDPVARDRCTDAAQVAAFVCRDGAREDAAPAVRTCRLAYRSCIEGCD
ncbi:MAG: hypothetical protein KBD01_19105 [Acidobacteria bacterium]|nr:hypothetical protein [Acidobacteriota bacterium]